MSPASLGLCGFLGYYAAMLLLWAGIYKLAGPECGGSDPLTVYGWANAAREVVYNLLAALLLPVILGMLVGSHVCGLLARIGRRSARQRQLDARTHMAVTGITQMSGKTTTLEALINKPPPPRRGCSW